MMFKKSGQQTEVRENMRGGDGSIELTALCTELPAHMRLMSTIRVAPGCSIGEHTHENETELYYFISGHATLIDDGVRTEADPGDVMSTASGHSHGVINETDEDIIILACIITD